MKAITQNERPIGKGYTGYDCFYTEDVVKETEKAFLVSLYFESIGDRANRWLPKSKMLAYTHIDNREIVDNGKDFVKNANYGKKKQGEALGKGRVLNLNTRSKLKRLLFAVHCQKLMN
jgi:hypothetical protein